MSKIRSLIPEELEAIAGGINPGIGPIKPLDVQAQDMYGDTMSAWDYMDWTAREHNFEAGDSIHDFPGGAGRQ